MGKLPWGFVLGPFPPAWLIAGTQEIGVAISMLTLTVDVGPLVQLGRSGVANKAVA